MKIFREVKGIPEPEEEESAENTEETTDEKTVDSDEEQIILQHFVSNKKSDAYNPVVRIFPLANNGYNHHFFIY